MRPKLAFFGLVRAWTPRAAPAQDVVCEFSADTGSTERIDVTLPEAVGELLEECSFEPDQARSYLLGHFDLQPRETESFQDLLPAQPTISESAAKPHAHEQPPDNTARMLAAILHPPLEFLLNAQGVLAWPAPLLPFQAQGVATLLDRRVLLLADDMGLGKTVQVIAAIRILQHRQEARRCMVVCPTSVVRQWQAEFAKWAPELCVVRVSAPPEARAALWNIPTHIHLVSYDTLRGDILDLADSPVLRQSWDVIVLDEASRIKNREAGVSQACKLLPGTRRWALTGTPLENRVEDLASVMDFLLRGSTTGSKKRLTNSEAVALLPEYQLRRRKDTVLKDLPPKTICELFVELGPAQRATYDRAEREGIVALSQAGDTATVASVLELIVRLKQICNADPASADSSKLEDIASRVERLVEEGHRALVFSQFTDATFGVRRVVSVLRDFRPLAIMGDMSGAVRSRVIDTFNKDDTHKVLVLSLRAGGVGLNLQSASYVFHLDRWWNPAIEDQAESRAHRMGQPLPVTVYRYICADTIEERIHRRLEEKRALFKELVDDVSVELPNVLSADELFGLFGLAAPRKRPRAEGGPNLPDYSAMTGEEFEDWLGGRLRALHFETRLTPMSRDGGFDIVATRVDDVGLEEKLLIQCKNAAIPAGVEVVRALRGVVPDRCPGTTPIVASPSGFSADARAFAEKHGVRLWGAKELEALRSAPSSSDQPA